MLSKSYGTLTIEHTFARFKPSLFLFFMTLFDFLIFGLVSGLSPGPIMALCLGESLKHGARHAFAIPFAIPVANLFIAPTMVITLALGSHIKGLLEIIPFFGAALLIYLGIQEWKNAGAIEVKTVTRPFLKAILIDLLSPFGYLIWLTVLGPTALRVWNESGVQGFFLYYFIFMDGVVASLLFQVFAADMIRPYLSSEFVKIILKVLAIILILFGIKLLF